MKIRAFFFLCLSVSIGGYCLFFYRLGDRDLWASHEARAAQDAQRILDEGDWLLPRLFDDQVELQKPPLYYWLVAGAGWLRGGTVGAVAVRLPAALAGSATVVCVFWFLKVRGRPIAAIFAALILATSQHFIWIARTGRIDMPLTFTVTVSILCHWSARQPELSKGGAFIASLIGYLAVAAGLMLKGPVGAILPAAVVTVAAIVGRQRLMTRSLLWGLPLVIAIAAPWYLIAHLRTHGEFTRVFFWYHNVERATGGAEALAVHPWWFYGPRLAFDFLPWSPFLVAALWFSRSRGVRENNESDFVASLGFVWLITIVILLSLSRFKRADYLLPAYPGAAIWLGCVGERLYLSWRSPTRARWLAIGFAGSSTLVIAGWVGFLNITVPRWNAEHNEQSFAAAVRELAPKPSLVLLFRVEDHLLAYHLGRPLNTFLEWENLNIWVSRPGPHYVLMPAECASDWRQYITSGTLEELTRFNDRSGRPKSRDLLLMRTHPGPENRTDGSADRTSASKQRTNQRADAGLRPGGGVGDDR
jgi:4-amino-4-deoxy-L-arabinose transferase-like glycosyltransferase